MLSELSRKPEDSVSTWLDIWKHLVPTSKKAWSDKAFDLLLFKWGVKRDKRLQGLVTKNCSQDMRATVDSPVAGSLNETKIQGIKQVLHATRMPPKAFCGAAPPQRA